MIKLEKEKKYLLKQEAANELRKIYNDNLDFIVQGYLLFDEKSELRVRVINNVDAKITYKIKVRDGERLEIEHNIPLQVAKKLLNSTPYVVRKFRAYSKSLNTEMTIDFYNDFSVLEVEYNNVEDVKTVETYLKADIIKDVTNDPYYSNLQIAIEINKK